jgi:hypothetical protein
MELYCACGERINTSGGNINSVEQWSYIGQTRVLIYAVCSHGKVVVDNRSTTVEPPKCDHCGTSCGTDCDGSSHYTPDGKQSTPRVGYMGDINGVGCDPDTP